MTRRICLVACSKTKLDRPAPARDLYTSPLFRLSRAWAERNADAWYILSAKHGVVNPDTMLEPYDFTMGDLDDLDSSMHAMCVTARLREILQSEPGQPPPKLIVLAGESYWQDWNYPPPFDLPLDGMGIGERMQWLKRQLETEGRIDV